MSLINSLPLPERFLGALPLFIGVEVTFAMAILNKMSGVYGILSIFTGHPLNAVQWLFYISSFMMIYYYAVGFTTIQKPRVLTHAAIVVVYTIDTALSLLFIIYFAGEWMWNENETAPLVPGQDYSKSASQAYEYGWIIFTTLGVQCARVYFNLVLISFYKKLGKYNKDLGIPVMGADIEVDLKNKNKFQQLCYKFEVQCYKFLSDL